MSRLRLLSSFALVAATTALAACGSSTSGADSRSLGTDAAAGDDASDAGAEASPGSTYPAFPVDAPQIQANQKTVLASPVVVTVTWPGDANASTWEGLGDGIGASSYWSATTAEYGVGPATSGPSNHVRVAQPLPSSLSYTDLQNYVISALSAATSADGGAPEAGAGDAGDAGGPNPAWPAPTLDSKGHSQTIYSLFIASSTTVTDPGSGQSFCTEGGLGYHDDVVVGGVDVTYAVTLECPSLNTPAIEETAVHETVEAATNPYPESNSLGYVGFDPDHLAWDLYTGFNDELADACQNWQDAYYQESGAFPYWVQRSWSNAAAKAGHDPCVPAAAGVYHGMTLFPSAESTVKVDLSAIGAPSATTQGFKVTVGKPLTFQVGFFSDASTAPWTIGYDFPAQTLLFGTTGSPLGNGKATVSIDKKTGQNGDEANVTVTVTQKGPGGFHVMAITWDPPTQMGFLPHYLPIVLVDQ